MKKTLKFILVVFVLFNSLFFFENVYASSEEIPKPVIKSVWFGSFIVSNISVSVEHTDDDYGKCYEIMYGINNNPNTTVPITDIATGSDYISLDLDLIPTVDATYYFKVRRCYGNLKSEWSDVFVCKYTSINKPVITDVRIVDYNIYSASNDYSIPAVYVSWNKDSNAIGYFVCLYKKNGEDDYYQSFYQNQTTNNNCQIPLYSVVPNSTYYVGVIAYSYLTTASGTIYSQVSELKEITIPNKLIDKITLDKNSISLKSGSTYDLQESLSPTSPTNRNVTWTSSNANVATVSNTGLVTAISKGQTIITCSSLYGDAFAVCKVIVTTDGNNENSNIEITTGSGKCGDNAIWELDENGVLTISGTGPMWSFRSYDPNNKNLHINYSKYIKKIIIQEGITEIGEYTFSNCNNITSIEFPESLEKINYLGSGLLLSEVTIPKNVSYIDGNVFRGCDQLSTINVETGNNDYFSIDGVLFEVSTLTLISYPKNKTDSSYIVPNGIECVGKYAFYDVKSIENVTLPNSLKSINEYAFSSCKNLTNCDISSSVYNIASSAFYNTGLTTLILPSGLKTINSESFSNCDKIDYIMIPKSVVYIHYGAFNYCDSINYINYEGSQEDWRNITIGLKNDALVNATVNYNSTHIHKGGNATCFSRAICDECGIEYGGYNHNLTQYGYKPASCADVGWDEYETCSLCSYSTYKERALTSHNVEKYGAYPATCETDGNNTYYKCSVCEQFFGDSECKNIITHTDTIIPPLGHNYSDSTGLCYECDKVKPGFCGANITWELDENGILTINGTGEMWQNFSWPKNDVKEVIINYGVTNIGKYAFRGCNNLSKITIPESVIKICEYAFSNSNLKELVIPNSVETMEKYALYGCNELEELTMPFVGGTRTSNNFLGYLFYSTTSKHTDTGSGAILYKTTYHIPENLKKITITSALSIEKDSFKDCDNIETIILPNTLNSIHYLAFDNCTNLVDIYFSGTNIEWCNLFKGELKAEIHFLDVIVNSISLDKSKIVLAEGQNETLTATIVPSNATNKEIIWCSSNENIATVVDGTVTAKSVGTTLITASTFDGKKVATCVVVVDYKAKINVCDYQIIGTYVLIDIAVDGMTDTDTLYFAAYDINNNITEIQTPTLENGATRLILPINNLHKFKVFVLENNLRPIAYHLEKIIN